MSHFVRNEDQKQRQREFQPVGKHVRIREQKFDRVADDTDVFLREAEEERDRFIEGLRVASDHKIVYRAERIKSTRDRRCAECEGKQKDVPGTNEG